MSTIGSAGSVSGLYQFFQGVSVNNTTTPTSGTSTTSAPDGTISTDASQSGQVSGHHHHHGGGGGAMFKQIQSAVTSALQTAQANGTDQDPNQVIEDAISSVLKNAGNGTSAAGANSTNSATQSASDPDGDGDSDASGAAEGSESAKQSFFQGLQALGVDPQQFHQDFLTAVQNAQNGNVDPSTAFQSFPPGSGVDTFA